MESLEHIPNPYVASALQQAIDNPFPTMGEIADMYGVTRGDLVAEYVRTHGTERKRNIRASQLRQASDLFKRFHAAEDEIRFVYNIPVAQPILEPLNISDEEADVLDTWANDPLGEIPATWPRHPNDFTHLRYAIGLSVAPDRFIPMSDALFQWIETGFTDSASTEDIAEEHNVTVAQLLAFAEEHAFITRPSPRWVVDEHLSAEYIFGDAPLEALIATYGIMNVRRMLLHNWHNGYVGRALARIGMGVASLIHEELGIDTLKSQTLGHTAALTFRELATHPGTPIIPLLHAALMLMSVHFGMESEDGEAFAYNMSRTYWSVLDV